MNRKLFLGIDTSNYTTSAAIADGNGKVLLNAKCPLPVREGERGLRQSDAVFHHVKNLPSVSEDVRRVLNELGGEEWTAVGCSATPRDNKGSYMPCFLSGLAAAEMTAASMQKPLYRVSHQRGHVMAALYSACENHGLSMAPFMIKPFLAFHVSGGTTDLLLCEPDEELVWRITCIGGSKDINGGQAIDRTGVRMGLCFPAGPQMDKAALTYTGKVPPVKISVKDCFCNLSGLENKTEAMIKNGEEVATVSAYTLTFIAKTLEKMTQNAKAQVGDLPVIFAGGVMSSQYIRKILSPYGYFADGQYAADNGAGVALLTAELYRRSQERGE